MTPLGTSTARRPAPSCFATPHPAAPWSFSSPRRRLLFRKRAQLSAGLRQRRRERQSGEMATRRGGARRRQASATEPSRAPETGYEALIVPVRYGAARCDRPAPPGCDRDGASTYESANITGETSCATKLGGRRSVGDPRRPQPSLGQPAAAPPRSSVHSVCGGPA